MAKGKGGKGNDKGGHGGGLWSRPVGTRAYLKNYRKGLQHQAKRAEEDCLWQRNTEDAEAAHNRLQWILQKQYALDVLGEMIVDKPWKHGGWDLPYGRLDSDAKRPLTQDEISWNEEFMRPECALQQPLLQELDEAAAKESAPAASQEVQ